MKVNNLLIKSLKLPEFKNIKELSILIGVSSRLLYCLSQNTEKYYTHKIIPKKNGTNRCLSMPSYTLKIVQRWILKRIIEKIIPSKSAMAFRVGKNFGYKQNATFHSDTLYMLSIDLKDFFDNIKAIKVYYFFISIGYCEFAAMILTDICTLNDKLPQGGVCSPALSNLLSLSLDKRLIGLSEKRGIRFTRYADDMCFSCDNKVELLKIFPTIKKIISEQGFIINDHKTYFSTPSNRKKLQVLQYLRKIMT